MNSEQRRGLIKSLRGCLWSLTENKWFTEENEPNILDLIEAGNEAWGALFQISRHIDPDQLRERKALLDNHAYHDFLIERSLENFAKSDIPNDGSYETNNLRGLAAVLRRAIPQHKKLIPLLGKEGWHRPYLVVNADTYSVQVIMVLKGKFGSTTAPMESQGQTNPLKPDSGVEKFPVLEPFHEPGKLPPKEERKEIVQKIRARTLSRVSQSGAAPELGSILHPPQSATSPDVPPPTEIIFLNPRTVENSDKDDEAAVSDPNDTAWMHSDDSEPKVTKKPKKKKPKKKATSTSVTRSNDLTTTNNDTETNAAQHEQPTNAKAVNLVAVAVAEEEDDTQGQWSTVLKAKSKKKDEAVEKNVNRVSVAKGSPKKPESSKTTKSKPKTIDTTTAEPKHGFRFQEEEFPDLGSRQALSRKKPSALPASSTAASPSTPSTQASYGVNIVAKGSSQKVFKHQVKSARNTNGSQSPPVASTVAAKSGFPEAVERSSLETNDLDPKDLYIASSADTVPKMELSIAASNKNSPSAATTIVQPEVNPGTEELDAKTLPTMSPADSAPDIGICASVSHEEDQDSDKDSFSSESTMVDETYHHSLSNSDLVQGNGALGDSGAKHANAAEEVRQGGEFKGKASTISHSHGEKLNSSSTTADSKTKASSNAETSSKAPHPLVEQTKNATTSWVSNPGKITVNDMDASELLGHQYPPSLTVHDHPDVNIFLHSDWIACAYCDCFIRETNGGAGHGTSVQEVDALMCSRCGPCSLTRYCSRACVLNDVNKHWEKCGGDSCGVFPLDWTTLPKHYYAQLPALGTWSKSYNYHYSRERARQMTYIANLYDGPVPHVRKAYFDKLFKAGANPEFTRARLHIVTSGGTWNQPQAPGDYFLFIDHQYIDECAQSEEAPGRIAGPFRTISAQLLQHKNSEGLCPATAVPLQLPANQKVAFNRLINACFVTNNTKLVEYLWHWIRVELATNPRIYQWCRDYGITQASLFLLWSFQFEKEFGLSASRQSKMLDETSPSIYHPYSDASPDPWCRSLNVSSIHSLIYEHELYHPLLRAWRCHEPNDPMMPRDPWARFRGDGFLPMKRPSGQVILIRTPQLPWNNGWQGMPPFLWQQWLETKHTIHIREALERFISAQENLILKTESQQKSSKEIPKATTSAPTEKKEGEKISSKWIVLHNGNEMASLTELRSRLKSLSDDDDLSERSKVQSRSGDPMNPLSVDGTVDSVKGGQKPVGATTSRGVTANTNAVDALKKSLGPTRVSGKHALNPTVPEFRSLSPKKSVVKSQAEAESTSIKSAPKVEAGVPGEKESTSTKSAEKVEVMVRGAKESASTKSSEKTDVKASKVPMPSKPLATSAQADKWLATKGFAVRKSSTPTPDAPQSSSSATNSNGDDLHARWKAAEQAFCAFVNEEMAADQARKKKIVELRVKLALAEREDDEAAKAGIARVAVQQKKVEALRKEMREMGSEGLEEKVREEEERDRVQAVELLERDRIAEAAAASAAASTTTATATGADAAADKAKKKQENGGKVSRGRGSRK